MNSSSLPFRQNPNFLNTTKHHYDIGHSPYISTEGSHGIYNPFLLRVVYNLSCINCNNEFYKETFGRVQFFFIKFSVTK